MKNREWLRNQSEYDLLCGMNKELVSRREDDDDFRCIMDALGVEDMFTRCRVIFNTTCDKCIQSWLNEERS